MNREMLASVAVILLLTSMVSGRCEQACSLSHPDGSYDFCSCNWGCAFDANTGELICPSGRLPPGEGKCLRGDSSIFAPKDILRQLNHPPIADAISAVTDENTPLNLDVLAQCSDPDNDTLAVISASTTSHGTAAVNADWTITYAPAQGYCGPDSFTYTISDGLAAATATVMVSIDCTMASITCWTVTVKEIDDCIQGLADEAFMPPALERRRAFTDKLNPIGGQIADGNYQGAMYQLRDDVRVRTDGYLGGNPGDDWIADQNAQIRVCGMIDELIANLEMQSHPPRVYPG
jgi:hypothetical protein